MPPLANYGILTGHLFRYAGGRATVESSPSSSRHHHRNSLLTTRGSLERDCNELEDLMNYLIDYFIEIEKNLRWSVGHSTGCEDAVYFLEHAPKELRQKLLKTK